MPGRDSRRTCLKSAARRTHAHPSAPSPTTPRFDRKAEPTRDLSLPAGTTAAAALDRVLRLPGVGSKRFLTTKVDRSVTGLIAQQQCCGPLQLPVADVAVMAQTHFGHTGAATAIGEQPLKVRAAGSWADSGQAAGAGLAQASGQGKAGPAPPVAPALIRRCCCRAHSLHSLPCTGPD